ncbi:choice-of-anchor I domain-containing protein [Roseococcus sp. DSY-14]|uniref:choice-of-anchor I domain-containing protein n=1 Tax=Roseococcus sp. DSY-14 TaxID=3369650 RepID=UPI00387B4F48
MLTGTTTFTANHLTNGGAAGNSEVVAHDAARGLLFVMGQGGVDALDAATGALRFTIAKSAITLPAGVTGLGTGNSVAVSGDNLAMTFDGPAAGQPGIAAVFTLDAAGTGASFRAAATVGVVPDMITFTPDGTRALVAVEAEPTAGYATDAPGGLAVLDVATWTSTFHGFGAFDARVAELRAEGVKIANGFGTANTALPSLDLEPEYVTVSGTWMAATATTAPMAAAARTPSASTPTPSTPRTGLPISAAPRATSSTSRCGGWARPPSTGTPPPAPCAWSASRARPSTG